jgi:hypothetical protein
VTGHWKVITITKTRERGLRETVPVMTKLGYLLEKQLVQETIRVANYIAAGFYCYEVLILEVIQNSGRSFA